MGYDFSYAEIAFLKALDEEFDDHVTLHELANALLSDGHVSLSSGVLPNQRRSGR